MSTMKQAIYKYPLPVGPRPIVTMPQKARILSVQNQRGALCVWAAVNPTGLNIKRGFTVLPTGLLIPDDATLGDFLGTVQFNGGELVFHVFDLGEL